jgi:hypothetical protein
MVLGVAKMPVPTMRLKIRKKALRMPISRFVSVNVCCSVDEPRRT